VADIEVPVLIVGGSLVGMSSAMLLGHYGVRSLVVEHHRGTAIHPRAAQITQRTMEIFRTVGVEQIVGALHAASVGLIAIPIEASALIIPAAPEPEVESLTPREMETLEMLAEGLSNKQIAARLHISEHTAKFHVNSILSKLGAGTRTEAVMRGLRSGLLKV